MRVEKARTRFYKTQEDKAEANWEWGRRDLRPQTDWKGLQKETQSDLMVWIKKWRIGRLRKTPSFQPLGIKLVMMPFTEMEKIGGINGGSINSVLDQFSLKNPSIH